MIDTTKKRILESRSINLQDFKNISNGDTKSRNEVKKDPADPIVKK